MEDKSAIVVQMAIDIEERGIKHYQALKKFFTPQTPEYKLFNELEAAETYHKKVYYDMLGASRKEKILSINKEDYKIVKKLIEGKIFHIMDEINKMMTTDFNITDIIFDSIGIEMDAIYFFRKLAKNMAAPQLQIINQIIEEEKTHVEKLFQLRTSYRIHNKI